MLSQKHRINNPRNTVITLQGGPERMQQLRPSISRTSSIKLDLFFILLGRKFIFQQNDTMTINFG